MEHAEYIRRSQVFFFPMSYYIYYEMSMDNEFERADSLISTGMYEEAIVLLNRILAEEPDNPEALWRIGVAFTEQNEPVRALKALKYFFRFEEEHPQALEACGCAYFKMGNYDEAKKYLEHAERIMPDSSSIKRNLGVVYHQMNEDDSSYEKFQSSYDLNPEDYRTEYALAMAHIQFQRYHDAEELLERMLSQQLPTDFRKLADESYQWVKKQIKRSIESE